MEMRTFLFYKNWYRKRSESNHPLTSRVENIKKINPWATTLSFRIRRTFNLFTNVWTFLLPHFFPLPVYSLYIVKNCVFSLRIYWATYPPLWQHKKKKARTATTTTATTTTQSLIELENRKKKNNNRIKQLQQRRRKYNNNITRTEETKEAKAEKQKTKQQARTEQKTSAKKKRKHQTTAEEEKITQEE